MTRVLRTLIAARAKIERPESWTQEHMALDRNGVKVAASSASAVRWCAIGALRSLNRRHYDTAAWILLQAIGSDTIIRWNDASERTHAEVLAAFDRAIKLARGE